MKTGVGLALRFRSRVRRRPEIDAVARQQPAEIADRLAHGSDRGSRLADASRRDEAGGHGEADAPRCDLLEAVGERCSTSGWRTKGLEVAGNSCSAAVAWAASASAR
jgi:hypothetical protein